MHHGNCLCGDNLHSKCKPTLWLAVEFENHGQVLGTRGWTKGLSVVITVSTAGCLSSFSREVMLLGEANFLRS